MVRDYCKRGVIAGAIAGSAYGVFVAVVASPLVGYIEGVAHHGHDHAHAVTEATTVVSVGSGILWGVFLGAVFSVAYYVLEPALPGARRVKPYVLAGAGFLTVSVVPWLVLPPAVPGAEAALGADTRLLLYGALMIAGALLAAVAIRLYDLAAARGRALGLVAGATPVLVAVALVPRVAPTVVTAGELPAELAAAFQGLVVVSQASLWLLLAASYARLRPHGPAGSDASVRDDSPVAKA